MYTIKPQLMTSIFGGKQYNQVCDIIFPKSYSFDTLVTDVSINMAIIHQMILRYISVYFATLPMDQSIGLLRYDQLVVLLKNKFLNAPNEDVILEYLEYWIEGNDNFRVNALEFD